MCLLMQCIVFVLFYNSLGVCVKPLRTNYIHPISKDKYNLILSFAKSEGKCDIPMNERTRQYRSAYVYYWRYKDKLGFIKSIDHRPTDHRPTDHRPTDHRPLTHRPTDPPNTDPPTY